MFSFWRKKKEPKDYSWEWLQLWLGYTEEQFNRRLRKKRHEELKGAVEAYEQATGSMPSDDSRVSKVVAAGQRRRNSKQ